MANKTFMVLLACVCGALLSSPLLADEQNNGMRVQAGSRNAPQEQFVAEQARLQLAALETNKPASAVLLAERAASSQTLKTSAENDERDTLSLFACISSHPGAFHNILEAPSYYSFSLEDGSVWTTSAYIEPRMEFDFFGNQSYYYLVSSGFSSSVWYPSDSVVIQPNHWSSGYDFWLTNEATGASIPVNLHLGPYYDSMYKHAIVWIDYDLGTVYLEDGTRWIMDSYWAIRNWMVNDTVIIGGKDSWLFSSSPNVLINVNMLNYASGKSSY